MFDGVDSGVGAHGRSRQTRGVRRDLRPSLVGSVDHRPRLVNRPRRCVGIGAVEVQLDEVRTVIELTHGGVEELAGIARFHGETGRECTGLGDPRARGSEVGDRATSRCPPVLDGQGERTFVTVDRSHRRPNVSQPPDA